MIRVVEGEAVAKGTLLVSLEDAVSRATFAAAQLQAEQTASLDLARLELDYAERLLARIASVRDERAVSLLEREQAQAARDKAQANLAIVLENVALAKSRFELERARLETQRILAPFDGVVASIDIEPGQKVFDDTSLVRLVDPSELTVVLYHPWRFRDRLQVGIVRELQAESPLAHPIRAELVHIDPVLDAALQSVRCRWRIDNRDGRLPAGFLVVADCEAWPVIESAPLLDSDLPLATSVTSELPEHR